MPVPPNFSIAEAAHDVIRVTFCGTRVPGARSRRCGSRGIDIGGIYRLDGNIVQVTFISKLCDPHQNPVEQGILIWPANDWYRYAETLHWDQREISRGTPHTRNTPRTG
jgi:hypothetical protein